MRVYTFTGRKWHVPEPSNPFLSRCGCYAPFRAPKGRVSKCKNCKRSEKSSGE